MSVNGELGGAEEAVEVLLCGYKLLRLSHLQSLSWLNQNVGPNGLGKSLGRTKTNSSATCKLTQGEDAVSLGYCY